MFGSLTVQDTMSQVLARLFRIPVNGKPIAIIELGGLPPGYRLGSARLGAQEVSRDLVVGAEDITGVIITVAPPPGSRP